MSSTMKPEEIRDFIFQIAPELKARPLYVIDHGANGFSTAEAGGFAIDYMPHNVFDLPNWQGPGAILAIDQSKLHKSAILAVAIHEAAHLLPAPSGATLAILAEERDRVTVAEIREGMAEELEEPYEVEAERVLKKHGPLFLRRCTHLLVRALAAGFEVYANEIHGYTEWISPLTHYMDCFLGDAIRMQDASFHEIDLRPMPEAAVRLFEKNKQHFYAMLERKEKQYANT